MAGLAREAADIGECVVALDDSEVDAWDQDVTSRLFGESDRAGEPGYIFWVECALFARCTDHKFEFAHRSDAVELVAWFHAQLLDDCIGHAVDNRDHRANDESPHRDTSSEDLQYWDGLGDSECFRHNLAHDHLQDVGQSERDGDGKPTRGVFADKRVDERAQQAPTNGCREEPEDQGGDRDADLRGGQMK